MRTHPLIALAVVATAITTVTVFGQSVPRPAAAPAPVKKIRHVDAAREPRQAASSAVPAWLVTPVALAASATQSATAFMQGRTAQR